MADTSALLRDVLARLDALEQRNDALERTNATQAREIDTLKQQNAALLARTAPASSPVAVATSGDDDGSPLERMSRRWVLQRGMQMAAAPVAAGVLLSRDAQPAAAAPNQFGWSVFGAYCESGFCVAGDPAVRANGDGTAPALHAISAGHDHKTLGGWNSGGGTAVYGETTSDDKPAIYGHNFGSDPGVFGSNSGTGSAVHGYATGSGGTGVKGTGPYGVWGESTAAGLYGVMGKAPNGIGVWGEAGSIGIKGNGQTGVAGYSSITGYPGTYGEHTGTAGYGVVGVGRGNGAGVVGRNAGSGPGVNGQQTGAAGHGVLGDGKGPNHAGVFGSNPAGFGVRGEGVYGVAGYSATTGSEGVYGGHTGTNGWGVVGDGKGATSSGVLGRNSAGAGVRGEGKTGGSFRGAAAGYGGQFEGGLAQVRLVPQSSSGKPTTGSHLRGELYLDKVGTLFVCTAAGTPGTWRRVSTTLA